MYKYRLYFTSCQILLPHNRTDSFLIAVYFIYLCDSFWFVHDFIIVCWNDMFLSSKSNVMFYFWSMLMIQLWPVIIHFRMLMTQSFSHQERVYVTDVEQNLNSQLESVLFATKKRLLKQSSFNVVCRENNIVNKAHVKYLYRLPS